VSIFHHLPSRISIALHCLGGMNTAGLGGVGGPYRLAVDMDCA